MNCLPASAPDAVLATAVAANLPSAAPAVIVPDARACSAAERNLRACRRQLRLVLRIARGLTGVHDPAHIQTVLLDGLRTLLRADALFVDHGAVLDPVFAPEATGEWSYDPAAISRELAGYVRGARRAGRSVAVPAQAKRGYHALLAPLVGFTEVPAVVVALRRMRPPFRREERFAAEAVLRHGAQLLRTAQVQQTMQRAAVDTVCALVNAIGAKDNYTSDHSERVGRLARLTGEALCMSPEQVQALEWAGQLHDVGKIGIAEQILNKPGRLTDAEFAQMRNHPRIGYEMLRPVAHFEPVLEAVLYHHENHDGAGYPAGLAGEHIPLAARIIHVVDVFDALTTCRPYRAGYGLQHALRLLERDAGRVTDPDVTRCFVAALHRFAAQEPDAFQLRFAHLTAGAPEEPA